MLAELKRRWRFAGLLAAAERDGKSVIVIPAAIKAEIPAWVWRRQVERANRRWEAQTAEISLEQWATFMQEQIPSLEEGNDQ